MPLISKQTIAQLKKENLDGLYKLLVNTSGTRDILFILENLGPLPKEFDPQVFIDLLLHPNENIRFWSIKNLGKVASHHQLNILFNATQKDNSSSVRREATSSIGRMRTKSAIPLLIHLLQDKDPKVVLQAIRGLAVFKKDSTVLESVLNLSSHPNETIQSFIKTEFRQEENKKKPATYHIESPRFLQNTIVHGDVKEVLKYVPDESIHLTFTSPPYYNARDYSIYESYDQYLDFLTDVFNSIFRVTKDGRFLIVNTSPIIIPRVSRSHSSKRYPIPFDLHARLVSNGWEFIDDIVWVKPETSVKNRNAGFLQHRKPLAYKPNAITEYLMVYRKMTDKLIDHNIRQYDWRTVEDSKVIGSYETSNVWKIDPTFDSVHSAVFPIELCNRVIKFYSYKNDLIFDPFGGSGTLARAAKGLHRKFFLTEQQEEYVHRMKLDLGRKSIFDSEDVHFVDLQQFIHLSKEYTNEDN